jgi:hypothetical protein
MKNDNALLPEGNGSAHKNSEDEKEKIFFVHKVLRVIQ